VAEQSEVGVRASLRPAFQEYRLEDLDLTRDADLIIERTLAVGDRGEIRWLLRCYGRHAVIDWLGRRGARRLPHRRYNLWCVLLDVQREPYRDGGNRIWPH